MSDGHVTVSLAQYLGSRKDVDMMPIFQQMARNFTTNGRNSAVESFLREKAEIY